MLLLASSSKQLPLRGLLLPHTFVAHSPDCLWPVFWAHYWKLFTSQADKLALCTPLPGRWRSPWAMEAKIASSWRCYRGHISLQSLFQAQMMLVLLSYPQWTENIRTIWLPLPFFQLSAYPCRVEVVFPRAKSALCVIIGELFSCHSSPFPIASFVSIPFLLRNFLDARHPAKYWHFKRCCKRPGKRIFNFSKQLCLQGLTVGAVLGKTLN